MSSTNCMLVSFLSFGLLTSGCAPSDGGKDSSESTSEGVSAGDCVDRADNDGDGLFDCDDDGCAGSPDCAIDTADTAPPPDTGFDAEDGLVAYFPFDGDATDHGPSALAAVANAVSYTTDRRGFQAHAGRFDGTSSYVQATTDFTFNSSSELSWMAWVYWDGTGASPYPTMVRFTHRVCGGAEAAITGVRTGSTSLGIVGRMFNECVGGAYASTTLQRTTWYHVAVVHNGAQTRIYVNGVATSTGQFDAAPTTTSTGNIDIGFGTVSDTYFDGNIDEVRLYSRALTPAEVAVFAAP